MAKRFTDTAIWQDEWFMNLTPDYKLAFIFIKDSCDAAGVYKPNKRLADMMIGCPIDWEDFLNQAEGRIKLIQGGYWWITRFIEFQYGKLSKDCKPHIPIYRLLEKHGINIDNVKMSDTLGKSHNISPAQKLFVLQKDEFKCCYCGKTKEERNLVIDHVIPRKKGGDDSIKNLVASCAPCNLKKSDFSLEEFCDRNKLDFQIINKRVSERLSNRVYNTLKEKEKDKEEEKEEEKEKEKESAIIFPFNSTQFLTTWDIWKKYRKDIKKPYKGEISEQAALKKLSQDSGGNEATAIRIIENSIANQWQGLFELKENGKQTTSTAANYNPQERAAKLYDEYNREAGRKQPGGV